MQDTVTINAIDQSNIANGYVLVSVTISVNGVTYKPNAFKVNALEAESITAAVGQQAEDYRNQVPAGATQLDSLIGMVIGL